MVNMLEEFPGVRVTFNLVPSLLVQVQAFAEDRARDRHLEIGLKPAAELGARRGDVADRQRISCAVRADDRAVPALQRAACRQARAARPSMSTPCAICRSGTSWPGWIRTCWRRTRGLSRWSQKGSRYSEADKAIASRGRAGNRSADVIPAYRRAQDRGQVELSTSPFYHPILPLLVRLRPAPAGASRTPHGSSRDSPDPTMRGCRFGGRSTITNRRLGAARAGCGPRRARSRTRSFGLVSEAGLDWIATDEDILARSLGVGLSRDSAGHVDRPDLLYRAYRLGDGVGKGLVPVPGSQALRPNRVRLPVLGRRGGGRRFRRAACAKPDGGSPSATGEDEAVVSVILDGENAWEHYSGGGRPFLRALYGRLAGGRRHSDRHDERGGGRPRRRSWPRSSRAPGFTRDFWIWIGHPDDQRAWTQLGRGARRVRPAGRHGCPPRIASGRSSSCRSPKAATGSGGTATTIRRTTIATSTSCSGVTCETPTRRSAPTRQPSSTSPTSRPAAAASEPSFRWREFPSRRFWTGG